MSCLCFQVAYAAVFALVDPLMTTLNMGDFAKFVSWSLGPLCGFIVQPMVGYYSDRCRSRFGRRRPFIVVGGIFTAIGIFALFLLKHNADKLSQNAKTSILLITVGLTYVAINTIQGNARSIIGDIVPDEQQDLAFTISSVLIGLGSIITNLIGGIAYFIDSKEYQDQSVTIILITCSIIIIVSLLITVFSAKEQQFTGELEDTNVFKKLFKAITNMSKPMSRAALMLTISWVGFYSFLIKETTFFSIEVFPEGEANKGLCFGLFVTAVMNTLTFIYGLFHMKFMELVGMKAAYSISHFIMAICFGATLFTRNRWVLLCIFAPVGIANTVFNSVPFSVTSAASKKTEIGINLGAMNIFLVLGQQITNFINIFVALAWENWPWLQKQVGKNQLYIGFGSVGSLVAGFLSFLLIVPGTSDEYRALD
jgi:solute carrier family 45 protein 1/2/4